MEVISFVAISSSLASLFTIELTNKSVMGEFVHEAVVIGAQLLIQASHVLEATGVGMQVH
jgi:hypothetical protein